LLANANKWSFIQNHDNSNNDKKLIDGLNGNEIKSIKDFKDQLQKYYKQKLHEAMDKFND
jgi:hemerythrin superfamily protein